MRGFWKKKLPAALLALTLMVSLIPAAAAEGEHHFESGWTKDDKTHWNACTDAGCTVKGNEASHHFEPGTSTPATCYQPGTTRSKCTTCGYEQTITSAATGNHVYDDARWTADNTSHWHACTTNGCASISGKAGHTAAGEGKITQPTCTAAGKITYTCEVCKQSYSKSDSLPALGHSYGSNGKCIRCGVSNAVNKTGQNITIDATTSKTVGATVRSQINSKFTSVVGSSMTHVRFTSPSGTSYGKLYSDSDKTSLKTGTDYYYSSSTYGSYPMASLYFVPGSSRGTYSVSYTAYDQKGNQMSGTLYLENGSSSSDATVEYQVKPGEAVIFDRSDFNDIFKEEYDKSMRWVEFYTSDTLSNSKGAIYVDYDGDDEELFDEDDLEDVPFYYSSSSYGDYPLNSVSFVAGSSTRTVELEFTAYYSSKEYVEGTVIIEVSKSASSGSKGDITYEVAPGEYVEFDRSDFNDYFQEEYSGSIRWVEFDTDDTLGKSFGTVYYDYDGDDEKAFTSSTLSRYDYYYKDEDYGDYALNDLSFVAGDDFDEKVTIEFTAYYDEYDYVEGTLVIVPEGSADTREDGDINYEVEPGEYVEFDRSDFNDYFQEEYSGTLKWVEFDTDDKLSKSGSTVYFDYDGDDEEAFTSSTLSDYRFYYKNEDDGEFALNDLSFVADDDFDEPVTLNFTAYYSDSKYVEGTLVISPAGYGLSGKGDIIYATTYNTNVQINPNDIARFLQKTYSTSTLQYVKLGGAPSSGNLYYNYYSASNYGAKKLHITNSNYKDNTYYFSPSSTKEYALGELTYIPSGFNYCATIPFTAYGSGSRSVSGTILISVSQKAVVSEVYGVTPRNTSVSIPETALYLAVNAASGLKLSGIQILQLPDKSVGTLYEGSSTSTKASTSTRYTYGSGSRRISSLRFVPASGYSGSVEIPYMAYQDGKAIASGKFCLGVVSSIKIFTDVPSSSWCYKYVTELSDAKVIDGYTNGTFRPDKNVTYGQALKLIMLATGYQAQSPTGAHPFSGYLARAKTDGLISGTVNLDASITRLALAQLSAKAMRLSTTGLSGIKPFTDTSDVYVQALNAAGIVEGYFANGTSTYRPNNLVTRGQISAIVWRIERSGT